MKNKINEIEPLTEIQLNTLSNNSKSYVIRKIQEINKIINKFNIKYNKNYKGIIIYCSLSILNFVSIIILTQFLTHRVNDITNLVISIICIILLMINLVYNILLPTIASLNSLSNESSKTFHYVNKIYNDLIAKYFNNNSESN